MACSSATSKEFSRKELLSLLSSVLDNLDDGKIKKLSEEQFKALFHFLNGRDTFACLPTGHGKTLIYQIAVLIARTGKVPILPSNPLVVVVSPLNALISDQLESCQRLKLKAVKMEQELFGNDDKRTELDQAEVVYCSPETLENIQSKQFLVKMDDRLVGIVVDESHCVVSWGLSVTPFRAAYSKVGDVRGFTRKPFLCLTATAGKTIRSQIMKNLHMKSAKVVNLSPNKSNIKLCVSKLDRNEELDETFASLIEDLKSKGCEMKKTIIYCRSITACGDIFEVLLENLPNNELYGMFHSKTPESIQKNVLYEFVKRDSKMRLVVATCALGMGVDIPDVELIIHYGIPTEVESYVQEIGRGGRDGRACAAFLYYKPYHLAHCDKEMRDYVKATSCRRKELLKHFKEKEATLDVMHKCCDFCTQLCKCQGADCVMQLEAEENVDTSLPLESLSRTVESEERELFIELLKDIDKLGTYETLGSDLILELAANSKGRGL
ncbi:ATP-dependent helicase wrn-1-like isoform X2 [Montipora capricornis]|uniref:ATP-dependent helicase wrn-1-like isoform X2 n=1 Tax=Montipora capricornis TaxID=246305 RepID=UPI0035F15224